MGVLFVALDVQFTYSNLCKCPSARATNSARLWKSCGRKRHEGSNPPSPSAMFIVDRISTTNHISERLAALHGELAVPIPAIRLARGRIPGLRSLLCQLKQVDNVDLRVPTQRKLLNRVRYLTEAALRNVFRVPWECLGSQLRLVFLGE